VLFLIFFALGISFSLAEYCHCSVGMSRIAIATNGSVCIGALPQRALDGGLELQI
jgi:hypothetical protein